MAKNEKPKGKTPASTAENTSQHHRLAMGQAIPQSKKVKPSTSAK